MPSRSRTLPAARQVVLLSAWLASLGCSDPQPTERFEPMRAADRAAPPRAERPQPKAPRAPKDESTEDETDSETQAAPLPERAPVDPAIEQTLELISSSGLRFYVPDDDPETRPTEYTAEQFASMLSQKWDWVGYDLVTLEPWLDEIATSSFKTQLPYLVELDKGRRVALRPWLDRQLAAAHIEGKPASKPKGEPAATPTGEGE